MRRRDLLLLKTTSGPRTFELACASLYLRFLDIQRPSSPATVRDDYCLGEPEPQFEPTSARELFGGLQRDLAGADVLRLVEPHWLADADLRREVDILVAGFRAAGGRVEMVSTSS
jgi:hypothetical protein